MNPPVDYPVRPESPMRQIITALIVAVLLTAIWFLLCGCHTSYKSMEPTQTVNIYWCATNDAPVLLLRINGTNAVSTNLTVNIQQDCYGELGGANLKASYK